MECLEKAFGKGIVYMDFFPNTDYAYYLSNRLTVYDLKENRIVQQINQTGNSRVALSPNRELIGCIHPNRSNIDLLLFSHTPLLTLKNRYLIKEVVSPLPPLFSPDSQYLIFLTGNQKVWVLHCFSGDIKCIYSCATNSAITALDVNEIGIVLSIYDHKGDADKQQIIVIDYCGKNLKHIRFFEPIQERIHAPFRRFRCYWAGSQLLCLFDLDNGQSSIQLIDIDQGTYSIFPQHETTVIPIYAKSISISQNKKYMSVDGLFFEGNSVKNKVSIYSLFDFLCLFTQEYDVVWSAHFAFNSNTLIICGKKQYMIRLDA